MDELEHRLRSALTEMAEEVSPSHHAWAEQERRLALKSRRNRVRPALMAAVAAAVVALIAVPVVVLNARPGHVDEGAAPLPPENRSTTEMPLPDSREKIPYRAVNGETLTAGPMTVGSKGAAGKTVYIYSYAVRSEKGDFLCSAQNAEGNEINGKQQPEYGNPVCVPIVKPKHGLYWGMTPVLAGNSGGTYIYVMSQPADKLLLRDVNERLVVAHQKAAGNEFVLFTANMESKAIPKAWTVKDNTGKDLQHGP